MPEERYTKQNGYTLRVDFNMQAGSERTVLLMHGYTKYFNFQSCRTTTIYRDWTAQPHAHQQRVSASYPTSSASGSSAISTKIENQNFTDMAATGEIEFMHAKLIELDGNPPPLEDILKGRYMSGKKNKSVLGRN